jgi:hypothetical protein
MGWSFGPKPHDVAAALRGRLTWENARQHTRCLDLALTLTAAYAAVETINKASGEREVWAAVILLRYCRERDDPYPFGTKELEESMGPRECGCPARILDLLTPTTNQWALEWRAACRARLERSLKTRMPKVGTRVRFAAPVSFKNGLSEREFTVAELLVRGRKRRVLAGAGGGFFRISRACWESRPWSVVDARDQGVTRPLLVANTAPDAGH